MVTRGEVVMAVFPPPAPFPEFCFLRTDEGVREGQQDQDRRRGEAVQRDRRGQVRQDLQGQRWHKTE